MKLIALLCLSCFCLTGLVRRHKEKPKVIDVHIHAPLDTGDVNGPRNIRRINSLVHEMDSLNIRFAILNGVPEFFEPWNKATSGRLINFLLFPCVNGKAPNGGRPCFKDGASFPDINWLRSEIIAGRVKGLGEITAEYIGMAPNDSLLEPYWSLAEEYDLPVCIHMGPGPPDAAYPSNPTVYGSPNFRVSAGNPMLLEDVLLKHKKLRVFVMHAGWPMLNEMIYILYAHPNVYVDTGVLQWAIPRKAYYHYLQGLMDAGHGKRIMFGSDGYITEGVKAIMEAQFLSEEEREDILYNNAARFLRLDK